MKVTTVRFSEDLWNAVVKEAEHAGVSASQFIREAALARAAAAAGTRGDVIFDSATIRQTALHSMLSDERQRELEKALAILTRVLSGSIREESEALLAESRQARRRAAKLHRAEPERSADLDASDLEL
jgi:hypothetical protein